MVEIMSDFYDGDYDGEVMNDCDDFDTEPDYENEARAEASNERALGFDIDADEPDACEAQGHEWFEWKGCSTCAVCGAFDC